MKAILRWEDRAQRDATLRAALVAATIVNVNLAPGKQPVSPSDFLPDEEEDWMSEEEGRQHMDRWASRQKSSGEDELTHG